jgi:hypothetical protein
MFSAAASKGMQDSAYFELHFSSLVEWFQLFEIFLLFGSDLCPQIEEDLGVPATINKLPEAW